MEYQDLSGEQVKRIVNFFKLLGGFLLFCLTILISVGVFFTYNSTKDMKEEMQLEVDRIGKQIENQLEYSQIEIDKLVIRSEKQISQIKDEAVYNANKEAQRQVDNFFRNDERIKSMVRNSAEKVLGEFEDDINELAAELPNVLIAVEKISNYQKDGLVQLKQINDNSKNHFIQKLAKDIYYEKIESYHTAYNNVNGVNWGMGVKDFLSEMEKDPGAYILFAERRGSFYSNFRFMAVADDWTDKNKRNLVDKMIKNVQKNKDLNAIAMSFYILIELTELKCELFDFKSFDNAVSDLKIKAEYL